MTRAPEEARRLLDQLLLPHKQRLILTWLLFRWGTITRGDFLVARLWDDEGDEVAEPHQVLCSHISKLRAALHAAGWTIESRRGVGYKLAPLPAEGREGDRPSRPMARPGRSEPAGDSVRPE